MRKTLLFGLSVGFLFVLWAIFLPIINYVKSRDIILEKQDDSVFSWDEGNQPISEFVKQYTECWRNILLCLNKMKDEESFNLNKDELRSELAKMDELVYLINHISKIDDSSDIKQLRSQFSQNQTILKKIGEEYGRLEKNDFFGEKKHFVFFEESIKRGKYPAVLNRRGFFSPILGDEGSDGMFLDNLDERGREVNTAYNPIASSIIRMEDLLRNLTHENVDKSLPDIRKQADYFYKSISSHIHHVSGVEYWIKGLDEFSYRTKRFSSLLNDVIDQYIILKSENFLGSEKLKEELAFFEKDFVSEYYELSTGNRFEDNWQERLSVLKRAQKGKFYTPIEESGTTEKGPL